MLVQFSFSNYKSFRTTSVLNLTTPIGGIGTRGFSRYGYNLLKAAAVYGANASGKTILFKAFDFNIDDLKPHEIDKDNVPEEVKERTENHTTDHWYDDIHVRHRTYNNLNERLDTDEWFSLVKDESFGTNRLLSLSYPIIRALKNNSVVLIDEFDSGIHPSIAKEIVELFYGKTRAQLIVNTQSISLFSQTCRKNPRRRLFRRDQVYFVNKNRYGESSIDSLMNHPAISDRDIERRYLEGDVDAVPYVDTDLLDSLLNK